MNFARYIKRKKLKNKYNTNQIRPMWTLFQYRKYISGASSQDFYKLTYRESYNKMKQALKNFFRLPLYKRSQTD